MIISSSTIDATWIVYHSFHTVSQPSCLAVWKQFGLKVMEWLQREIVFLMATFFFFFFFFFFFATTVFSQWVGSSADELTAQPVCWWLSHIALPLHYCKDKEWRNENGKLVVWMAMFSLTPERLVYAQDRQKNKVSKFILEWMRHPLIPFLFIFYEMHLQSDRRR